MRACLSFFIYGKTNKQFRAYVNSVYGKTSKIKEKVENGVRAKIVYDKRDTSRTNILRNRKRERQKQLWKYPSKCCGII